MPRCKPFNPQPLISHLTNSNGCGNLQSKVLLTVSPFRPPFFPRPNVYPQLFHFCPQPHTVSHAASCSCGLFARFFGLASFVFNSLQPLFAKYRGVGIPRVGPHLCVLGPSAWLSPFPATHTKNVPVTPFAATHTKMPSRKSFPCHTYKELGGWG
jgi:hypothetical protein